MKQLTFIILLLLKSYALTSQAYVPMAVDSATWFFGSTSYETEFDERVVLRLEGDTIINNLSYSKIYHYENEDWAIVFQSRKLLGVLRDDVAEKKVYGGFLNGMQNSFTTFLTPYGRCDWGNINAFNEHLIYDFDVVEGDTIDICMLDERATISAIDTIERFGFRRRNLKLSDSNSSIMTEGIGTCIGIFKGEECFVTGSPIAYDLFRYCIGGFDNCDLLTSIKDNIKQDELTIGPNPVTEILNISSPSRLKNITILSIEGKLIGSFTNTNHIDMSDYESGLYILNVLDVNGVIRSEKIIKI